MADTNVDVKGLLSKKIGPVPVVLIPVAIIVGVGFSYYRNQSAASEPEPEASGAEGDAGDEAALNPVFLAKPQLTAPAVAATVDVVNDQETWIRNAISWLTQNREYSPSLAQGLVQKYLEGSSLTLKERSDIDAALSKVGLPPELGPVGGTTPGPPRPAAPAKRQGTPPLKHKSVGPSDNTVAKLTVLYYGRSDRDAVDLVLSVNQSNAAVRGNKPFPAGTVVNIPKLVNPKYYRATAQRNTAYTIAAVNSITVAKLQGLNPGMQFPVKVGTRVRVK